MRHGAREQVLEKMLTWSLAGSLFEDERVKTFVLGIG